MMEGSWENCVFTFVSRKQNGPCLTFQMEISLTSVKVSLKVEQLKNKVKL